MLIGLDSARMKESRAIAQQLAVRPHAATSGDASDKQKSKKMPPQKE
jgi:hypothetical protein